MRFLMQNRIKVLTLFAIMASIGLLLLFVTSPIHAASYLVADIAYAEPVDDALASTTLYVKQAGKRKRSFISSATRPSGGGIITKSVRVPLVGGSATVSFYATAKDKAGNVGAAGDILVIKTTVIAE